MNAEFQVAIDAVAAKNYDQARELLAGFLTRHPLDERVPQALFIFGQIHYAAAQKLEQDKAAAADDPEGLPRRPSTSGPSSSAASRPRGIVAGPVPHRPDPRREAGRLGAGHRRLPQADLGLAGAAPPPAAWP